MKQHHTAQTLMDPQLSIIHLDKVTDTVYEEKGVDSDNHSSVSLWQLLWMFLQTGATSWGGYMSLISVVQKKMNQHNHLVPDETIVKAVSLASVLPGPVAVNVVAYIGYQIKGFKGAFISMLGVLLPCFVMVLVLSYLYFTYGSQPLLAGFFAGIAPAVAAILFTTAYGIGKKKITRFNQILIALLSACAILFLHFAYTTFFIIIISGAAGYFLYREKGAEEIVDTISQRHYPPSILRYISGLAIAVILMGALFVFYIKPSSTFYLYGQITTTFSTLSISQFGGAYVVVPSMQKAVVDNLHWLSLQQFTDAIAMGQITPGPVYISAAFVGYKLLGVGGAAMATVAMFLPSAMLMLFCSLFLTKIEKAPAVVAAFAGIGAAITGMISATGVLLLYNATIPYLPMLILFAVCLFVSVRYKVSPVILIPSAGIAGLLFFN